MNKGFGKKENDNSVVNDGDTVLDFFNQAIEYHQSGKLQEAESAYNSILNIDKKNPGALLNLASIYKNTSRVNKAVNLLESCIKYNPKFVDAYSNLGNLLRIIGQLGEAHQITKEAILLNPESVNSNINMGSILLEMNRLEEAMKFTLKAIELDQFNSIAHLNLSVIYRLQNNLDKSVEVARKAISLNSSKLEPYLSLITTFIEQGNFFDAITTCSQVLGKYHSNHRLCLSLSKAISQINPQELDVQLIRDLINLLIFRKDLELQSLFKFIDFIYTPMLLNELKDNNQYIYISTISNLESEAKMFFQALKCINFASLSWESYLTKLRRDITLAYASGIYKLDPSIDLDRVSIAIAHQSFLNEYIYSFKSDEYDLINKIIGKIQNGKVQDLPISILASYMPLYSLDSLRSILLNYKSNNIEINELLNCQLHQPLEERKFISSLANVGNISNRISINVKAQYEQNPYPRWIYTEFSKENKIHYLNVINSEIKPNIVNSSYDSNPLQVLIAGCGTGKQIIKAQRYSNAQVTAIDISASSLCYSKRKISDYGINNVSLIQMDILDLPKLNKKFDVIECCGVLHHMEDPARALETLTNTLVDSGYLKLGLYSTVARQFIKDIRSTLPINLSNLNSEQLRSIRNELISENNYIYKKIYRVLDFFSISSFRDLLLHVHEKTYTLPQINELLHNNSLHFLGFYIPDEIKNKYKSMYPNDKKLLELRNWSKFEEINPDIFKGMYQFWASKK